MPYRVRRPGSRHTRYHQANAHRLVAEFEQLADASVEGDCPLASLSVVGGLGVDGECCGALRGVGEEWLDEGGVDILAIVRSGE